MQVFAYPHCSDSVLHGSSDDSFPRLFSMPVPFPGYTITPLSPLGCPPSDNPMPLPHLLSFRSSLQIFVNVLWSVIKFSADGWKGYYALIAVALQSAFGNVQQLTYLLAVHSAVGGLGVELRLYTPCLLAQGFQLSDERRPYPLVDTNYTHNKNMFG